MTRWAKLGLLAVAATAVVLLFGFKILPFAASTAPVKGTTADGNSKPSPEKASGERKLGLAEPLLLPGDKTAPPPRDRIEDAISRGLAFLARTQNKTTGGWVQDVGFKFNDQYEVMVANQDHVGVSALALMAFLAGGHLPGRGRYGDVVERGTDYIIRCVDTDTGYISANETRMYSHAFATLYLAEVYGMTQRADVHEKLQQAVDLTVKTQNRQGSWRYRPYAPDSDMSIAVCQLMALRAARNIGIAVPKSTITRAYDYIERSNYGPGSSRQFNGAFRYMIDQPQARVSFALAAAGIAALLHAGFYEDDMVTRGLRWLKKRVQRPHFSEKFPTYFYWYGNYYAAQVMFIANDTHPGLWDDFYWPMMSRNLIRSQSMDGSWRNDPGPGQVFGTAVASLILQIPYEYLPIFQR
ncbi:MAG: prenyltransferase [Planctomycetota bacterium]